MPQCPNCRRQVPIAGAQYCHECGAPMRGDPPVESRAERRKRIAWTVVLVLAGVAVVGVLGGRYISTRFDAAGANRDAHTVEYRVRQSANCLAYCTADLTLSNSGGGGTEQISKAKLPWSRSYTMASGAFAYVSAQAHDGELNLTVEIWLDGGLAKTSTSTGQFAVATASGSVP